jgi:thiosulfate/3-mercaptopyruvate sulfurtransferase
MDYTNSHALVSPEWLTEHLADPLVVILDGTSHLPTTGRNADDEFAAKHIPGARRFSIDDVADADSALPHMLPSADVFASKVGAMGISNAHRVVVYDVYGLQSAARAWWMFRVFGHDNVAILNGGLPAWEAHGQSVTAEPSVPVASTFSPTYRPELIRSVDDVLANLESKHEQVVDARAAGRFTGEQPEPRAGMRSGHIPGSVSLPYPKLLTAGQTVLPAAELRSAIDDSGLDLAGPITASCGSGVTACVIALSAYLLGTEDVAVYDGSWSEWGARADTPIDTGA